MTIASAFADAVPSAELPPQMAGVHLFTARLTWAAAQLLRADGAGLSLSADPSVRAPLGSSDEAAGTAQRLLFTTDEVARPDPHQCKRDQMAAGVTSGTPDVSVDDAPALVRARALRDGHSLDDLAVHLGAGGVGIASLRT